MFMGGSYLKINTKHPQKKFGAFIRSVTYLTPKELTDFFIQSVTYRTLPCFIRQIARFAAKVLINKCVFNFRYIFSIGGKHFKVRAYRIYIYFYAEKFFVSYFEVRGSWLVVPTLE